MPDKIFCCVQLCFVVLLNEWNKNIEITCFNILLNWKYINVYIFIFRKECIKISLNLALQFNFKKKFKLGYYAIDAIF